MPTQTISAFQHTCIRCNGVWVSHKPKPKQCTRCGSPYWDKERTAMRYAPLMPKQPGETVIIPWPRGLYNGHSTVDKMAKRLGLIIEYKQDGAHVTMPVSV